MYIILAMLAGASTVLSSVINSRLSRDIGQFKCAFVNYCAGLLPSLIYCIYIGATKGFSLSGEIPFYLFFGGVVGIFILFTSNVVYSKISAVIVTLLVFIGQIALGTMIDIFVFNQNISIMKIIGIIVIGVGIYLNMLIDKNSLSAE